MRLDLVKRRTKFHRYLIMFTKTCCHFYFLPQYHEQPIFSQRISIASLLYRGFLKIFCSFSLYILPTRKTTKSFKYCKVAIYTFLRAITVYPLYAVKYSSYLIAELL